MNDAPRIRAGHDDRSALTDVLAEAYAQGKLDRDEFDERSAQVMAARYLDELSPLVADLGLGLKGAGATVARTGDPGAAAGPRAGLAPTTGTGTGRAVMPRHDPSASSSDLSVAIFGGHERTGRWVVGRQHVSIALMGGNTIDLREVVHTGDEVVINAWAVMGGTEVIVPEDAEVVVDGFGFMGGFGWNKRRFASQPEHPNGPRIRITGLALMGGVGVARKPVDDPLDED